MTDNPTLARMVDAIDEISEDTARRTIAAAFETMTDDEAILAYNAAEPESPIADLLAIAAEARCINL